MNIKHTRHSKLFNIHITVLAVTSIMLFGTLGWSQDRSDEKIEQRQEHVSKESLSFRLKWLVYSSFAPHFFALEEGFFDQQNLKVEIQPGGPGLDPIKLVVTGLDLVGLASYDQILVAREKGIPVVAIAEDTTKSGVGFMSLRASGIKDPKDFVGRKVGVMLGTDKGTIYEALMNKQNIDRSKVQEIPIGFNLEFLFNGTVEVFPAFITNQPIIARNKGFEVDIIDPYEYGVRPGGNVYFTSEISLKEKRETLKRFLIAELRGIIQSQKMDDEKVVSLVMKHNPKLDKKSEIEIWKATKRILLQPDPERVGIMDHETWERTGEMARKYGLLKKDPDIGGSHDNSLVNEIHDSGALR